jgi:hypothetical protein
LIDAIHSLNLPEDGKKRERKYRMKIVLSALGLTAASGLAAGAFMLSAQPAAASTDDFCPYDLADDDTPQEIIDELCEEWERSKPPGTRQGTYTGDAPTTRNPTPPPPPRCNPPACEWHPL